MTKDEWKEALEEANKQTVFVNKPLQKLAGDFASNLDGMFSFNMTPEGIEFWWYIKRRLEFMSRGKRDD